MANGSGRKGIPENVIKNFNVYEVLEPIKVTPVAPLIDLDMDDSPQTGYHTLQKTTSERNTDFTLVDVFENIYVTPSFVNRKPEEKALSYNVDYDDFFRKLESGSKMNWSRDAANNAKESDKKPQFEFEETFDHIVHQKSRGADFYNFSKSNLESADTVDQEDLIDELLQGKSMAKIKISEVETKKNMNSVRVLNPPTMVQNNNQKGFVSKNTNTELLQSNASTSKKISQNSIKNNNISQDHKHDFSYSMWNKYSNHTPLANNIKGEPQLDFEETFDKIVNREAKKVNNRFDNIDLDELLDGKTSAKARSDVGTNTIVNEATVSQNNKKESVKTTKLDPNMIINFLEAMDQNMYLKSTTPTVLINNTKNLSSLIGIVNTCDTKSNISNDTNIYTLITATANPEIMATMPIQAAVKDNKLFSKNRIDISDLDKHKYNLTKGPDFAEKSIVLPQILNRIGVQKQSDEENNLERRLILDTGSLKRNGWKGVEIPVKLDPTMLMANCNKERLLDLKTRQTMKNFVKDGNILQ